MRGTYTTSGVKAVTISKARRAWTSIKKKRFLGSKAGLFRSLKPLADVAWAKNIGCPLFSTEVDMNLLKEGEIL
jgi:hypothetical protein